LEGQWLGLQPYEEVEKLQKAQVPLLKDSRQVSVLGLEFKHVITLGIRANPKEDLLDKDAPVVVTDRGGQATLHSPGQLVIYPMLCLRAHGIGVKHFVYTLMETTVSSLAKVNIEASYSPKDPGVYTKNGKIAFCGLKLDQSVVRHGLSINISNDLSLFGGIRSCGHKQATLDQVKNYYPIETEEFFSIWLKEFQAHFPLSAQQSLDMTKSISI
jgi:lipoyl(octanoyl) transferase